VGNNGNAEGFALHAKRSASFDLGNSDGIRRGNRLSSAYASDATGSNGTASAREKCDGLCADAIDDATKHHRAAATDPRAEPLGNKLARSDGVLCPPTGVDRKFAHQRLRRAICRSFRTRQHPAEINPRYGDLATRRLVCSPD